MSDAESRVEYELVVSQQRLDALCRQWLQQPVIALDTEFIRVDTFYPRSGLIQIADDSGIYLLDPLALDDWQLFRAVLTETSVTKCLHSGSEDLVLFLHDFKVLPSPLFDTQKAAAFLGFGPSISYLNLVRELEGVELEKGETRSDWLQRPLTERQLHYAALDVAWLLPIYKHLSGQLQQRGRSQMALQTFQRQLTTTRQIEDESCWPDLYQQMGAAWRLDVRQLGVLKELSLWREKTARSRNKPRTWIARDADLIEIASRLPDSQKDLQRIPDMSRNLYSRDAAEVLRLVAESQPVSEQIRLNLDGQPLTHPQRDMLKRLQKAVRRVSEQTDIAEELLGRKRQLIQLLRLNEAILAGQGAEQTGIQWPAEFEGWQTDLLTPALTQVFAAQKEGLHG